MQLQPFRDPPAFEDAFLFSAQRFFIASDRRFLPAALMPPRRFLGAAPPATVATVREVAADFDLRAAHRAFIAWDNRLLPAGVIPLLRFGAPGLSAVRLGDPAGPAPSTRARIALPILSRSLFRSETILSRSNSGLLCVIDS